MFTQDSGAPAPHQDWHPRKACMKPLHLYQSKPERSIGQRDEFEVFAKRASHGNDVSTDFPYLVFGNKPADWEVPLGPDGHILQVDPRHRFEIQRIDVCIRKMLLGRAA